MEDFFNTIEINQVEAPVFKNRGRVSLIDLEAAAEDCAELEGLTEERRIQRALGEADSDSNVVYDREHPATILAITREKLIAKLTLTGDLELTEQFLLAYRLFMTPQELAMILGIRLRTAFMSDTLETQKTRLLVFRVLKQWRDTWMSELERREVAAAMTAATNRVWVDALVLTLADKQLLINIGRLFVGEGACGGVPSAAVPVAARKKKASWFGRALESRPEPELPEQYEVLLLEGSTTLAGQLALVERHLFEAIDAADLWRVLRKPSEAAGPEKTGLQRSVEHFNQMCQWLVRDLIGTRGALHQTEKLKKLIKTGHKCMQMGNYASTMQITLALQNHQVAAGLKQAWARVPGQHKGLLDELLAIASPLRAFRSLRAAVERAAETDAAECVPFMAIFLSDLTSLAEAPNDYAPPLLPWHTYTTAGRIVQQFRRLQDPRRAYAALERHEPLYRFLASRHKQLAPAASQVFQ